MIDGAYFAVRLGLPGSGKTLNQTLTDVLPALLDGEEVFCNYWLNWNGVNLHYFPPTKEGFLSIRNETNCLIVMDELAQMFDPYDVKNAGDAFYEFCQLYRHKHQSISVNTQDISLVTKRARIVVTDWLYFLPEYPNPIKEWVYRFFGFGNRVRLHQYTLSRQRLNKLAANFEDGELDELEDVDYKKVVYTQNDIIRPDLDDYKIELIHSYCPKCQQRQGEQILKDDTYKKAEYDHKKKQWLWKTKKPQFCAKHHSTPLALRDSGIYDTDYLPPGEDVEIVVKRYKKQTIEKLVPCD